MVNDYKVDLVPLNFYGSFESHLKHTTVFAVADIESLPEYKILSIEIIA